MTSPALNTVFDEDTVCNPGIRGYYFAQTNCTTFDQADLQVRLLAWPVDIWYHSPHCNNFGMGLSQTAAAKPCVAFRLRGELLYSEGADYSAYLAHPVNAGRVPHILTVWHMQVSVRGYRGGYCWCVVAVSSLVCLVHI